jgi:hypothetical protein
MLRVIMLAGRLSITPWGRALWCVRGVAVNTFLALA